MQKGNSILQRASNVFRRDVGSNRQEGNGLGKLQFLAEVERLSKEDGFWIEDLYSIVGEKILGGQESEVFASKDRKYVVKLNCFAFVGCSVVGVETFAERLNAHNEIFPQDGYEMLGFAKDLQGNVCAVLRQPYVDGDEATQEEIDAFFDTMGAKKVGNGIYCVGDYEIVDALPNNVLRGKEGGLHFVDTFCVNTARLRNIKSRCQ